jgi:putative Mn2+ efflux pump MntP
VYITAVTYDIFYNGIILPRVLRTVFYLWVGLRTSFRHMFVMLDLSFVDVTYYIGKVLLHVLRFVVSAFQCLLSHILKYITVRIVSKN